MKLLHTLIMLLVVSLALNLRLYWVNPWYTYKRLSFIEQVKRRYFPYLIKPYLEWPENYFDDPRFNKK